MDLDVLVHRSVAVSVASHCIDIALGIFPLESTRERVRRNSDAHVNEGDFGPSTGARSTRYDVTDVLVEYIAGGGGHTIEGAISVTEAFIPNRNDDYCGRVVLLSLAACEKEYGVDLAELLDRLFDRFAGKCRQRGLYTLCLAQHHAFSRS